jgi:hypothetical protein
MLGVPASPGAAGYALLALGVVVAVACALRLRRRLADRAQAAVAVCLLATVAAAPLLAWRIVEDVRYTRGLDPSTYNGAGPVQAYLQPYLLDTVPALVPRDATYAAVSGAAVPYVTAREAYPSLAIQTLFPRISVADPRRADYVVAWGIDPHAVAPVRRVVVARRAAGVYPAVRVAEVRR